MAGVPRLMSAEQMVGAWILMTGATVTEKQKVAITNLLVECYESGYRKGKRDAQTDPSEPTDQDRYDSVSITGSGRQVDAEPDMMCDICGHLFGQHRTDCDNYPGEPCDPDT